VKRGFWNSKDNFKLRELDREWLETMLDAGDAPDGQVPEFLNRLEARLESYRIRLRHTETSPRSIREDLEEVRDGLSSALKRLSAMPEEVQAKLNVQIQARISDPYWEFQERWGDNTAQVLLPAVEHVLQDGLSSSGGRPPKIGRDELVLGVVLDYTRAFGLEPKPDREEPLDKLVALILEILEEPLKDRFAVIKNAIANADFLLGTQWRNTPEKTEVSSPEE